jgi:carbon storage regulator
MLVLGRKLGEEIVIGSGIRVTVLGIHKGKVRLGLAAPQALKIHRGEVRRRIDDDSRQADVDGCRPPV